MEKIQMLINDHKDVTVKIQALEADVYNPANNDDKIEFANKCVQLRATRVIQDALTARLHNLGIRFDGENYITCVDTVHSVNTEPEPEPEGTPEPGDEQKQAE